MSNCFQSPKYSGRVWGLDRKPLFHHKKANPNESGKKREEHTTDTALQANGWPSQHTNLQPSAILYSTSNFQVLSKHNQSQTLKQRRASAPSQGRSITHSCFVTWAASSRHVLEKLDCTKVKCNFSLRLYCPLHIVDRPTCTFTAAFPGFLNFRLQTLRKGVIAVALQNQQVWFETLCFTSAFIQYNTGLLKQLGPNNKHLLRNSLFPPDIASRAQRYPLSCWKMKQALLLEGAGNSLSP